MVCNEAIDEEGVRNRVMDVVGECVVYWLGRWWQRRKQLLYG